MSKGLFKRYVDHIKHSIIPKPYSHQVKMNIVVKKGQRSGTALIPCAIYAMDHSIDLNPALIRKKDRKLIKMYKPGQKIKYDSNNYVVELTDDEKKKGYVLRELERCKHCGQKLVISEVKQTRYRSCPSIEVKLGDPAKEDTVVPVEFGVNKSDITNMYWATPLLIIGCVWLSLIFLLGHDPLSAFAMEHPIVNFSDSTSLIIAWVLKIALVGFIWVLFIPTLLFKTYSLLKWYYQIKGSLRKSPYKV